MSNAKDLPNDLTLCHEVILTQSTAIQEMAAMMEKLKKDNEELQLAFKKLLQGNRREKYIDPNQKLIVFEEDAELQAALEAAKREAEQEIEEITYKRGKKTKEPKKRADSFPAHLRREVVEVPISPEQQKLIDEGKLTLVRREAKEVLHYKAAELYVVQYMEPILASVETPEIEAFRDEMPAALGQEGRYDASIAAAVVCGKFAHHIPYYRLQDIFAGSGWTPSRSTLDYLPDLVDEAIEELPRLMLRRLLASQCIGMDDTGVKLLMPREIPDVNGADLRTQRLIEKMIEAKKEGKPSLDAKMWAYSGADDAPYDIFDFRVSRHRDGPAEFLNGYGGHVMADCYSGNLSVVLDPKSSMTRMACWAHARRKLFEAKDNDITASALPLALIGQLYEIERRASDWTHEERTNLRQRESRMVLSRLKDWLDGTVAMSILPASGLGQAVRYIRNHWAALQVYTNDGRLPIDNNWVERLMKRVAIGRKNWLFIGSVRAGIRNANLMTIVSSAHRHDLDVQAYLEDVITHLNRGTAAPSELLPDAWKQSHPEAIRTYRTEERRDKAEQARLKTARRIMARKT